MGSFSSVWPDAKVAIADGPSRPPKVVRVRSWVVGVPRVLRAPPGFRSERRLRRFLVVGHGAVHRSLGQSSHEHGHSTVITTFIAPRGSTPKRCVTRQPAGVGSMSISRCDPHALPSSEVDLPTHGLELGHRPLVLALERPHDADLPVRSPRPWDRRARAASAPSRGRSRGSGVGRSTSPTPRRWSADVRRRGDPVGPSHTLARRPDALRRPADPAPMPCA
jgi:hypothetical protein